MSLTCTLAGLLCALLVWCMALGCQKSSDNTQTPQEEQSPVSSVEIAPPPPQESVPKDNVQPQRKAKPKPQEKKTVKNVSLTESSEVFVLASELHALNAKPNPDPAQIEKIQGKLSKAVESQAGYPKKIGEDLELLGFAFSRVGDEEYEMGFVFRTKKKLEHDYHIYVYGYVDKSHLNRLPLGSDGKPIQPVKWGFMPDPPASAWSPDDVVVVKNRMEAAAIPYDMQINLLYKDSAGTWQRLTPDFVGLGWNAAL